jgi:glycosyltransferase involved in cell wall biosynthesis
LPIIKKSINSVLQSTDNQTELLLVNNHPPYPEVSAYLKSFRHPRVKVLDFGRNLSHILGTQYAEKQAQGEYLVRMDDDAVVPRNNWIYAMCEALQRSPELAYVGLPFAKIPLSGMNRVSTPNFTIEYADTVLFTCVMFKRDVWRAHFVIPTQGIYGNDDNYSAQKAKELGLKLAYLVSHPCEHLERSSESDPLYGAWKLFYAFKSTQADFPVWRRSVSRITATEEQLMRGFGYSPGQIQEIRHLLSKNLGRGNPVFRTSNPTYRKPV